MKRGAPPAPRRGAAKAAKAEPEDDAGAARARALKAAASGAALSGSAALAVLDALMPCLPGGCRRTRDAPNCLCRLVPPPGSHREGGLWARVPAALATLNADTETPQRKELSQPAGLANLGATCYVNAVLQVLFANPTFRAGVYAAEPGVLAASTPLRQLRHLFAQLQAGVRQSADPAAFAKSLSLDSGVQQDGQEFMKLLLTLLERALSGSAGGVGRRLVSGLFCGRASYVTTCSACSEASAQSAAAVDWHELELNVAGFSTLEASLADLLSVEALSGDNLYACESAQCRGARREAQRVTRLRAAPPVLALHLKRFVYDKRTWARKKVTAKFAFPRRLDLTAQLHPGPGDPPSDDAQYDLAAILVHKGSAATSGHYIAHVRHPATGQWWQFDDERVVALGAHPLGDAGGGGTTPAKGGKAASAAAAPKAKGGDDDVVVLDDTPKKPNGKDAAAAPPRATSRGRAAPPPPPAAATPAAAAANAASGVPEGHLASSDAYLLLYTRRPGAGEAPPPEPALPPDLAQAIAAENERASDGARERDKAAREVRDRVAARQAEVRAVLAAAEPRPGDDADLRWISAEWLAKWSSTDDLPGEINNAAVLCAHGRLDPRKPALVKRLSAAAWARLRDVHRGGPELAGGAAVCRDCASAAAAAAAEEASEEERRAAAARAVAALQAAGWPDPEAVPASAAAASEPRFWVSRPWLLKWLAHVQRAPGAAAGGTASIASHFAPAVPSAALAAGPTAAVVCPHGALAPDSASRRAALPAAVWHVVSSDAERLYREAKAREAAKLAAKAAKMASGDAKPEVVDLSGDSPPPKGAPNGDDGGEGAENGAAAAEDVPMRDAADDVDAANAASRDGPSVLPLRVGEVGECADCARSGITERERLECQRTQCPLMIKGTPAPAEPGAQLRLLPAPWVAAWRLYHAGGRAAAPAPPGPLAEAVSELMPRCDHGRLLTRLPALQCRGGKWQAREAPGAEPSAAALAADGEVLGGGAVALSLVSEVEYCQLCLYYGSGDFSIAPSVTVQPPAAPGGAPVLQSSPPVCDACLAARAADERERAARFVNADIMVEVKHAPRDAPPPDDAAAAAAGADAIAAAAAAAAAAASAAAAAPGGPRRTSSRARRGRGGGQATVRVSATDTVRQLKAHILQRFQVHPSDQTLFMYGVLLAGGDDDVTLGAAGVTPGAKVFCAAACEHDPDDVAGLIDDVDARDAPERGFSGTGLLGAAAAAQPPADALAVHELA